MIGQVILEDAIKVDNDAVLGGMVVVGSTPKFRCVAADSSPGDSTTHPQAVRTQMKYYGKQMGEIVSGAVQAVNSQGVTLGLDMKAEGIMPRNHQDSW
jgi:N utilization substance protein A